MADMQAKIQSLNSGLTMQLDNQVGLKNKDNPNTYIEKRKHIMAKKKAGQILAPTDKRSMSRSSTPLVDGGSDFWNQDMALQSGELLVDLMKLQNILNFEFLKFYEQHNMPPLYANQTIN